jgi:hypothetical protein
LLDPVIHGNLKLISGMATHEEITHQALYQAQTNPTIKMLSQYKSFVQAGAYFPDWGYACLDNHQESELAHWPPFWEASINYIKSKYTKPYQQEANQLISFLFGVISHDVSDALWHSLNMDQGFIDVMKNLEFHGIYGKAHHEADIGGDLLISRFSKFEYLSNWEIPTTDLVTIYNSMGRNVTKKQIDICMSAGFGILMAEKSLGKYVLPNFAEKSPFLVESYFTHFRGGIESMSVAVVECWIKNLDELENGTINPSCNHMGTYYDTSQKREPPALLFIRDCISKIPSLVDVNSNSTSGSTTISESNLSRRYANYCILANSITVPKINTLFQNGLVKTIGNLISAGIDYIRSDNCQLPTGTVLKTKTDYSMFGTSLATGDFDSDGKADLVFGSPGLSTDSNIQNGGIYLIKGGLEKNSGDTLIEDVAELFTGSSENGARFGSAMAVVDLNMDGIDDLAISAPLTGATDELQYGKVYVLFGRKGLGFRTDGLFDLIIDGKSTNSTGQLLVLGSILKAIDLDSDGFMDLLIGSPDSTLNSDTQQIGTVKAFYSSSKHSGLIAHSNADWTLFGSGEYNNFGKSITKIGQKLYIGATGYKSNELENSGAVFEYELSKGQSRFVKTHFGDSAFGAYGSNLGEHLQAVGSSFLMVSSIGETSELARARAMNLPGILVDESGYQGGVVRIYHDLNGKLTTLQGSGSLGHFGSAFASVGESGIIISEPFSYGGIQN